MLVVAAMMLAVFSAPAVGPAKTVACKIDAWAGECEIWFGPDGLFSIDPLDDAPEVEMLSFTPSRSGQFEVRGLSLEGGVNSRWGSAELVQAGEWVCWRGKDFTICTSPSAILSQTEQTVLLGLAWVAPSKLCLLNDRNP
jgi:hypothetical protein